MDPPVLTPYETFARLRGERAISQQFEALWTAGNPDALTQPTIAIVGTRAATAYGKKLARQFASELGAAGCCIISGLALGIDAAAHQGALDVRAPTVGVLGGAHDRFFPLRNRTLAEQMLQAGGAVLSPYPPGQIARPWQFLERNGIVAALADALVVIEAPARSGALNTAGWAAGRIPVFAVPGDVDRAHVAGCHALIRDGAILARSAQDVIDDLRLTPAPAAQGSLFQQVAAADPLQARIVDALRNGECALDDLLAVTDSAPAGVIAALARLELNGFVEARPGQRYALR